MLRAKAAAFKAILKAVTKAHDLIIAHHDRDKSIQMLFESMETVEGLLRHGCKRKGCHHECLESCHYDSHVLKTNQILT